MTLPKQIISTNKDSGNVDVFDLQELKGKYWYKSKKHGYTLFSGGTKKDTDMYKSIALLFSSNMHTYELIGGEL